MSALRPEADIRAGLQHVCFANTENISPTSINDLVGSHEERWRDREAKRFGGLHVDDEVEVRGALERQLTRLRSIEDALDIACCLLANLRLGP
jgi:hypothetical protein